MSPAPDSIEQAFLDDIVAHPDDPSLWLILADWLDERDDPRAELVRLTWQLQHEADHLDFPIRQTRVQELLAEGMTPIVPRTTVAGIEFAWIPPGSFLMGEGESQHRATLTRGFWMGVQPVTQGQWQALLGNNPSHFSRDGGGKDKVKDIPDADLERFPVETVTWQDAQDFCARLSERLGERVTLPTEAQWEYACRAGTRTPYHFGSVLNGNQANCNGMVPFGTKETGPFLGRPTLVGKEAYPVNAFGLWDMHGNVWEWCADWDGKYPAEAVIDPLGASEGSERVYRGGGWCFHGSFCTAAVRSAFAPEYRSAHIGFRLARVSSGQE